MKNYRRIAIAAWIREDINVGTPEREALIAGRGQETYGEDPYLTARLGVAFVKGLQGNDLRFQRIEW